VNQKHLELCGSDEWAGLVKDSIIPWVLEGADLGDDVLEVGPGPGRTTDVLQHMAAQLTAVEVDPSLAEPLAARFEGTHVEVVCADATDLPFESGRFSAAVSFTMLHHVPSPEMQDRLFAEVARVLRAGGVFAGVDSLDSPEFRELHLDDTCVPIEPGGLEVRLVAAGFWQAEVSTNPYAVRFRARKAY
jgi:SAM-dependent methyltransferase